MTTVYAFAGKRGSGKSTAAQVLMKKGFVDLKFADPLKNMMRALYRTCDMDEETIERKIEGDLKEVPCEWLRGQTPRHAMQTLGTEWRDMVDQYLWSDILVKRVESGKYGDKIVCSDFRFPDHEEDAMEKLGAYSYRIDRPGGPDDDASKHASETGVEKLRVRGVLKNTGTVEDLRDFVDGLVEANAIVAGMTDQEIMGVSYYDREDAT